MYSLSHQIQKALHLAETEERASIGVFAEWVNVQPIIKMLLSTGQYDGKFNVHSRRWESPSESVIRFIGNDHNSILQACAGCQFSHVFTQSIYKYEHKAYIESRLRSAKTFKEPIGYYDEWGVKRYEAY